MSIAERRDAQEEFQTRARVLISTDAGGEGVNLQFAHVVINYDLPWSPTRIEQRIGRVDRIGQAAEVTAYNLVLESSVDARVLEVLERKLAVILDELGVDKFGDVLASVETHLDDLYTAAILDPGSLESPADSLSDHARQDIKEIDPLREALGPSLRPSASSRPSALRRWLEVAETAKRRMTEAGQRISPSLPEVVPCEPVPKQTGTTAGWWTMWEVGMGPERSAFAIFLTDTGAIRPDLADRLWNTLAEAPIVESTSLLDAETFNRLRSTAADHGYRQPTSALPSLVLRLAVRVEP
jgi:superfamily II DNA/RNA helicase